MRKAKKQEVLDLIQTLHKAHKVIEQYAAQKEISVTQELLGQCQECAISIGTVIEQTEGLGFVTVSLLEAYCETVYACAEALNAGDVNAGQMYERLEQQLLQIEESVKCDIKVRTEIVFFPYKASMWDSLESVYLAAKDDPDCDAYCVPIPYFDRNPDGSFGEMHYEGDQYPADIEVTDWRSYDFEERRPDAVFIHNPYDGANLVTSVHPRYYSDNLKKYTGCLVYVPYFASAGGMSEALALCPAYLSADYIVIPSREIQDYFDDRIPNEKFLVFGSPKFDRVIRLCKNPPEPPVEWKKQMDGKTVYFYNTSLSRMLANTGDFLKKMQYVFDAFRGRDDVCLLWRPHPLMESTFDSLRETYKPSYMALKKEFIDNNIGILDDTVDVSTSVALSDIYISDVGSSVRLLFGVVGKPVVMIDESIHSLPQKDDWRGKWLSYFQFDERGNDRYQVSQGDQLWFSENNDYHYKFYMDLGIGYSDGRYYQRAIERKSAVYVVPRDVQDLLIIKGKTIRKIELEKKIKQWGSFHGCYYNERYLFLYPCKYPSLVRFDFESEEVLYLDGITPFHARHLAGEWCFGGVVAYEKELIFASPQDNQFLFVHMDTLAVRSLSCDTNAIHGIYAMVVEEEWVWLLPMKGMAVVCWNPKTGETKEYTDLPKEFRSVRWPYNYECDELPFGNMAFCKTHDGERIIISPEWGNMYLSLDRATGRIEKWESPAGNELRGKNGYYVTDHMGGFVTVREQDGNTSYRIWNAPERQLFDIDLTTDAIKEVEIGFDYDDLLEHEPGFGEESNSMPYCLRENAFNSLSGLLDGKIIGQKFDKERQLRAFSKAYTNIEGTCGRDVYRFIKEKLG